MCSYTVGADLISQEFDGKTYTYLYDGHGTVRALANESGKLTDTYTYDAFEILHVSTSDGETIDNNSKDKYNLFYPPELIFGGFFIFKTPNLTK